MINRWIAAAMAVGLLGVACPAAEPATLDFIHTGFENASPCQWDVDKDGIIHVRMLYDFERNSPNRAAGHWHFQVQSLKGADFTLILHNFDNVWNGRPGSAISAKTICFASADGKQWKIIPTEKVQGQSALRVSLHMDADWMYLARLEPYRLSDLHRLLDEVRDHPLVEIAEIGRTVEGRPLEIVRVGNPAAPHRIVLRARAHAWEPGGNWVVQGLIRSLLRDEELSRECLQRVCVYVMPVANKDGVARGLTRFNMLGKDLNRDWDKPADGKLAPENAALEKWIEAMIARNQRPSLLVDLHNDEGGGLHISRPQVPDLDRHLARMKLFEQLLRKHTWFTEGSSGSKFRNPGSIGEGMLERYGIDACILEFNANWIAGAGKHPSSEAWEQFGQNLRKVLVDYFAP